ncbi:MAG: hypothetical protein OIN86_04705 [Candidatus Methanoperedens sp.]|nr:hypothetical protein [Candidatus Methanoperedens sp.]CAG0996871.1 hypothetical protein METP1_02624 [Methanosarcinales archaeon]
MELTYQQKFRAAELEKERQHYERKQKIREANKLTRERRALKLQQEKTQTSEERHALRLERQRKSNQMQRQKQKMLKEQHHQVNSGMKSVTDDSHQMTIMR